MPLPVVTVVDVVVPAEAEQALLDGFRELAVQPHPEGLVRTELLRGQEGAWRIQTTWRDLDAVRAAGASGRPPAALPLLEGLGAEHTHDVFTVDASSPAQRP